jgi:PD-(D/E)XK nuclease superfamily
VVPSRQRAHAARLAFAAAQLSDGIRVWQTPDVLTADAWLLRAVEKLASPSGVRVPRVLSPAEDWLLWRQCTAEATQGLDLLNRGALAESLRRAGTLAVEFGIDLSRPALAGAEAELLGEVQRSVGERCRALGAVNMGSLAGQFPADSLSSQVTCAGFLQLPLRLQAIGGRHRPAGSVSSRPDIVIASDESDEMEVIAQWCKRQIAMQADTRLLVILPGSPGARERLATLIRQAVDAEGWLSSAGANADSGGLVIIEGGAPLADVPVVAHALSTLRWLAGSSGEFEEVSEWLRAPYWDAPSAGVRARVDLWLRESGQMSVQGRQWGSILNIAPAPIAQGAQELARQIDAAIEALGEGVVSPRDWSERFRAALEAVHWPGARVRDSSEQQTVVRFHELLDEFGQLASSARAMSRDDAVHWFSELALRTAFRPADDDAVVTISAALADPVVLYDGIWVAGLHAEAFPQPVQPDPFLPLSAQIAAGIPAASASGRLSEARALLTAWRAATSELVLSAPARAEDLELLPSPLLAEWLGSSNGDAPHLSSAAATPRAGVVARVPAAGSLRPSAGVAAAAAAGSAAGAAPRSPAEDPSAGSVAAGRRTAAAGKASAAQLSFAFGGESAAGTGPDRAGAQAGASEAAVSPGTGVQVGPAGTGAQVGASEVTVPAGTGAQMGLAASAAAATAPPRTPAWLAQLMHRPNMIECIEDTVGVPWPSGQMLPAGTRSLELQNLCAFRAYSELRLGSSELGVPEPGVAPDVRGQLLHAALQVLWRQLRDSETLAAHTEPTLESLIERSVAEAADSVLGRTTGSDRSPLFARECRRTVRLIKTLCVLERTRNPFRVQDTEFEKILTVSGAQMKVRIDRLDALEAGGWAILDYKSGRRTTADWYGERPSHPQLLAYLAAIGEDVVAMATVNVTAREVRFDGIAHSSQLLPKVKGVEAPGGDFSGDAWEFRRHEWLACIERLARSFLVGRADVDPKMGACDYCHAVSVCRISDRGIDVAAELLPIEFEGTDE